MKTLFFGLLLSTVIGQASAQTAASWDLKQSAAATSTAAGIGTGGVTYAEDNAYYQFAMVAASGYSLDLNTITFTAHHKGQLTWSLRSSLDGYAADVVTGTVNDSSDVINIPLPTKFRSLNGIVRFRVYVSEKSIESISIAGEAVTGTLAAR
jgi:hypothetical protein